MSGANHQRVPGGDAPPMIGLEEDDLPGAVLVVRDFHGKTVASRPFVRPADAAAAEADLRAHLARAPAGDVVGALIRWFRREELRIELLQGWWV